MRVYIQQQHNSGVSGTLHGKRVWASGDTVESLLADCERAFARYKKSKEALLIRQGPNGYEVESATFIPTGLAGQGAAYNRVPCVQVTLQPDGTHKAKLAHLDALNHAGHTRDFMKRLGLYWNAVASERHLEYLEPICAVDFYSFCGPRGSHNRAAPIKLNYCKVHSELLPYRVSVDVLENMLGKNNQIKFFDLAKITA